MNFIVQYFGAPVLASAKWNTVDIQEYLKVQLTVSSRFKAREELKASNLVLKARHTTTSLTQGYGLVVYVTCTLISQL